MGIWAKSLRNKLDLELAQADTEHLEESGLSGVKNIAFFADGVVLALAVLVAQNNLALDHADGDIESAQLRLKGVLNRDVVLSGDLAGGRVDNARGDLEGAGGNNAGAGKVNEGEVVEVFLDVLNRSVGEDQADVAS